MGQPFSIPSSASIHPGPERLGVPARMTAVQAPIIPVVASWIRQHPGTISLGQGVVWYGPPPAAQAQIGRFLADPQNHKYKAVDGLPELLQVIAAKLKSENQIQTGPDHGNAIVVSAGGNMAFMNAVLAVTDPGDEVILQTPYYFNHEMAVTMAGAKPVLVPTNDQYQLRLDAIQAAITDKTRAIVTVSPNNPTGAVYPEADLRALNSLCGERGIYHIHDEAYEYFTYDGAAHFSPAALPGAAAHTWTLYSLSKAYGFASWRIGYMVLPAALLESVKKIQDTIVICPPVISQFAALGAMEAGAGYCRSQVNQTAEVRRLVLEELSTVADLVEVPLAQGAFYFLLRLRQGPNPVALTEQLVREHGVAVIPGTAFGLERGCHLRVAYGALEPATAREGLARLVRGLRTLVKL